MNEKIRQIEKLSGLELYGLGKDRAKWEAAVERFTEMILQASSDHIMESSDRYRKEYFADKVLRTFDGDGEYEIGTMEGLAAFEEKRNGNGS